MYLSGKCGLFERFAIIIIVNKPILLIDSTLLLTVSLTFNRFASDSCNCNQLLRSAIAFEALLTHFHISPPLIDRVDALFI